ncbi:MAG TPA: GNAT family N-acetyltransferase [Burkholderiaceae bacterium]|nr:GNAT family N-acetyltransferase [Burkholderiaceae bacterium]
MTDSFQLARHLADITAGHWNALAGDHPFLRHEYLLALEEAGCATSHTGWAPHYLLLRRDGHLAGAMPLYLKSHSRGEYVFDFAWAQAFAEHGLDYYPKLLGAIPFTPVRGPRILAHNPEDRALLARQAIALARDNGLSSLHILFPSEDDRVALAAAGFMFRENIQFHWFNHGHRTFDEFLASLSQPKRKKIRQDTKKVTEAGIRFRWLRGSQIDDRALRFFVRCYNHTYLEHGNPPYLNDAFFQRLRRDMPETLVLIVAELNGEPIATALNLRGGTALYGRYWGTVRFVPGLHFETCYTQAIRFCIEEGIPVFEGGAQGEHKLSRGLIPVETCSAHWIRDQRYAAAIERYLQRETPAMREYAEMLRRHTPYRQTGPSGADPTPPESPESPD